MEDGSGYYHNQGRPAAPTMQQLPPGPSKVGKDDPYFKARKAMFSKFPEDWKRKVTNERDNTKRLLLFESYVKQLKLAEDHQNRQLNFQRTREQHMQQAQQLQIQKQQLAQQQQQYQQKAMLSSSLVEEVHSNHSSPAPSLYINSSNDRIAANNVSNFRQTKILHPMIANNSNGMKRVHSPPEDGGVRTNVKRVKQEVDAFGNQEHYSTSPPSQQMLYGQKSPGGTVYLHQKTSGGQMRILPAMVTVMGSQPKQNKPLYVQTNSVASSQLSGQPTIMRKQNLAYRTEQGVRKVLNNFGQLSPLGQDMTSPAFSSSSADPESAVRMVPDYNGYNVQDQPRFRRILTPHGIVEERVHTPSPESVAQSPRNAYAVHSNYDNRIADTHDTNTQFQSEIMRIQAPIKSEIVAAPQQMQLLSSTLSAQDHQLEELRKNSEYRSFIGNLREKYSADIKRIMARIKIDQGCFPQSFSDIMQILSFKIPVDRQEWDKLEPRIQNIIESAGICYPLFAELKRLSNDPPVVSCENQDAKISLDPWNICRSQFIRVPQFVLDVVNQR